MKKFFDWLRIYAAREAKPLKPRIGRQELEKKFASTEDDEWASCQTKYRGSTVCDASWTDSPCEMCTVEKE